MDGEINSFKWLTRTKRDQTRCSVELASRAVQFIFDLPNSVSNFLTSSQKYLPVNWQPNSRELFLVFTCLYTAPTTRWLSWRLNNNPKKQKESLNDLYFGLKFRREIQIPWKVSAQPGHSVIGHAPRLANVIAAPCEPQQKITLRFS